MNQITDESQETTEGSVDTPSGVLSALDGADLGLFVLGPDLAVRWVNETAETYFGLDRAAVVGRDKHELVETEIKHVFERPERFAEIVVATYEDNADVEEFECHVIGDGERAERWLLHRSEPIESGPLAGGRVEHYTDITARKQRERALERERDRLDEFASVVSHDLRSPLSVAEGRLELARQECQCPHHADIEAAHERMRDIVDEMLSLAREGREIGDTERVDLWEQITRAWNVVDSSDGTATLEYDVDEERAVLEADADRLAQLLENLFTNAIDHGETPVMVVVESTAGGFAVEDDGPGIPSADADRVFDSGYSTSAEGNGYGLGIVRQIVDAHGWDVSVTDGRLGGARFEVTGVDFLPES
jgi:signal transduction histidine kinase